MTRYRTELMHLTVLPVVIALALSTGGCQDKTNDQDATKVIPTSLPIAASTATPVLAQDTPGEGQPLPTITLIAPPPSLPPDTTGIYDNFDDPTYEGTFDSTRFTLALGNRARCTASQQNGVLVVRRMPDTEESTSCGLLVDHPESVPADQLEDIAVSMLLSSNLSGAPISVGLSFDADLSDTKWMAQCGLQNFDDGLYMVFGVYLAKYRESPEFAYYEQRPLAYDRWYRVTLDVDHEARTLSCLVDGFEMSTYSFDSDPYSEELAEATFLRWLGNTFSTRANGTVLLDDFQLIPPP